jgi:hypothetical protein
MWIQRWLRGQTLSFLLAVIPSLHFQNRCELKLELPLENLNSLVRSFAGICCTYVPPAISQVRCQVLQTHVRVHQSDRSIHTCTPI